MHVFVKKFLFFHSICSSIFVFKLSVCVDKGRWVLEQKADRRGQEEGGGLITGKNARISVMDDPC